MEILAPWYEAMRNDPKTWSGAMAELGISDEYGEWVKKTDVLVAARKVLGITIEQKLLWSRVDNVRRHFSKEYAYLFPKDPLFERNRSYCHVFEAWFALALLAAQTKQLHIWLAYFTLDTSGHITKAKSIIFDGELVVNGLLIEGKGIIKL